VAWGGHHVRLRSTWVVVLRLGPPGPRCMPTGPVEVSQPKQRVGQCECRLTCGDVDGACAVVAVAGGRSGFGALVGERSPRGGVMRMAGQGWPGKGRQGPVLRPRCRWRLHRRRAPALVRALGLRRPGDREIATAGRRGEGPSCRWSPACRSWAASGRDVLPATVQTVGPGHQGELGEIDQETPRLAR
jgi:hypothetical protein